MVNNYTNINKPDNHLSPQLIQHKTNTTEDVVNTDPGLEQVHTCGKVNLVMGPNPPLLIVRSPTAIHL